MAHERFGPFVGGSGLAGEDSAMGVATEEEAADAATVEDTDFRLSVQGLSYSTPDGSRKLANHLNFTVAEGSGVVIRGPSGAALPIATACSVHRAAGRERHARRMRCVSMPRWHRCPALLHASS